MSNGMGSYAGGGYGWDGDALPPAPGAPPDEAVMAPPAQAVAPAQLPARPGPANPWPDASQDLQQAVAGLDGTRLSLREEARGTLIAPGAYAQGMYQDYPGGPYYQGYGYGADPGAAPPPPAPPPEPAPKNHLGISLLLVATGAAVGWKYGGMLGALAGGLGGGVLVNGYRAAKNVTAGSPDSDREAAVSATYAVVGGGAALWLLYQAKKQGKMKKNASSGSGDDDDEDDAKPNEPDADAGSDDDEDDADE